jgi:uncharacterized protein (TIGR03435 family)
MNRVVLASVAAVGLAGHLLAQSPAPPDELKFDVVSVKPDTLGPTGPTMFQIQPGGRFTATNVAVTMLINQAYRIQSFQLTGAPSWASTERFDISAKAPDGVNLQTAPSPDPKAPPGPVQLMLRAMLADRFKLKLHTESREMPAYDLVIARPDGKLGPGLVRSSTDCAAEAAAARARGDAPAMPAFGTPMRCGMRMGPGQLSAGSALLAQFVATISQQVGRTVVDRTGLTGNFDINLTFTPDRLPQRPAGAPADGPFNINGVAIDPNGPTLFTAIQEQLGLKLESSKTNMDVLTVDSLEHPTED